MQSYLIWALGNQLERRPEWEVLSELNVLCGPDRIVPDVVLARRNATYTDGDLIEGAALAIEIMSPGQTIGQLFDKADRLVRHGSALCLIIWPERARVWSYTNDDVVEESQRVATGIEECEIDISEMWRALNGEPESR